MKKTILLVVVAIMLLGFFGYKYLPLGGDNGKGDTSLSDVKKRGKLIVGSDIPYGAMEFFDKNGKAAGVDIDIAQEIASSLGVKLEVKDYEFDNIFSSIKNEEIDFAISSITITEERQKEMLFSIPYFNGGQAIVTLLKNDGIDGINDIAGKKIGVQTNTTGKELVKKYTQAKSVFTYSNLEEIVEAIKRGDIEVFLVDYVAAVSLVQDNPFLRIIGGSVTQEFYGIATKLENKALMEKINSTLREMKRNGKLEQIKYKWLK